MQGPIASFWLQRCTPEGVFLDSNIDRPSVTVILWPRSRQVAASDAECPGYIKLTPDHVKTQALSSWGPQNDVCTGWEGVECNSQGVVTGL